MLGSIIQVDIAVNVVVVYYTLHGHTRKAAEDICRALRESPGVGGITALELSVAKSRSPDDLQRYVWCQEEVSIPIEPAVRHDEYRFTAADLIVLGTPVWAGTLSPPMRSFLRQHEFFRKAIALFCTYDGRAGACLGDMRALLSGSDIVAESSFRTAHLLNGDTGDAYAWGCSLASTFSDEVRDEASGA